MNSNSWKKWVSYLCLFYKHIAFQKIKQKIPRWFSKGNFNSHESITRNVSCLDLFLLFWFSFFFVMIRCFQEISWPCHHQSFFHVWPIARQEDILKYYCIQPKISWPGVPEMSLYSYQSIIGEGYSVGFPTGKLFELSVLPSKSSAG